MATFVVTGPLAVLTDDAGKLRYYYQGAVVPADFDQDQVRRLVGRGLVSEVEEPEELTSEDLGLDGLGEPPPAGEPAGGEEPTEAPPKAASKEAWVEYAVSKGSTREAAEQATKQELIDAYGA